MTNTRLNGSDLQRPASTAIKTPDQRLRVFVSSTLQELAAERVAARRAIEGLRLSPVMFELGARPHPPSDVYRAYLDQSHIFIGIYGDSYGWVAPGMEISGLEDEYLLSDGRPRLIYVKQSSNRQDRLSELLERIGREGVSYKRFTKPADLEKLIADDLALLLTERFEQAAESTVATAPQPISNLPLLVNAFIGRESDVQEIEDLIEDGSVRLVTITGPGGVGKSRLALEVATQFQDRFSDGAHLVLLQSVRDPDLVASTLAHSLQADETEGSHIEGVIAHLSSKQMLLVLDNFEQVMEACDVIVRILSECPQVFVVVTSREVLNLRGEREISLPPLDVPPVDEDGKVNLDRFDAVRLFAERAAAANPSFAIGPHNLNTIAEITRRLDGLPLAIELAAARSRILTPEAMLERLQDRFRLLSGGWRDLPERHRTLRRTIDWSFELLSAEEQNLFATLSIFEGGATLEAIEAVCGDSFDVLDGLASLLEKSLVCRSDGRYSMLESIREYALDRLRESGELADACRKHADHYLDFIEVASRGIKGPEQEIWMHALDLDLENIRAALRHLLSANRSTDAASAAWGLWQYWWLHDHLDEGRRWMNELLSLELADLDRARARAVEGVMAFWQSDFGICVPAMAEALEVFEAAGDEAGVALCQLPLGFAEVVLGYPEQGIARFSASCEIFDRVGDLWGSAISRNGLGWIWVGMMIDIPQDTFENAIAAAEAVGTPTELGMALGNFAARQVRLGEVSQARDTIGRALELLFRSSIRVASSYGIDVAAEVMLREGEMRAAAKLFGAADGIREAVGIPLAPMHEDTRGRLIAEVRQGMEEFEDEYFVGRSLSYREAMREAISAMSRHEEPVA